ncbi:CENP-B protein, partial [Choiromyces venosus 120613-1]
MLVLDGHSSHVNNIQFIEYYIAKNIHLICLPAHTTHILQPLDVGIFSPLATNYQNELEDFLRNHRPNWTMRKGDFYPMYHKARVNALRSVNIQSAWRASGMIPFNRQRIM